MKGRNIVLYYREGCHLCEELVAVLHRGWTSVLDDMQWVDVDRDPALVQRYGQRVPVLVVEGEEICQFQADVPRLIAIFGEPANPV